MYKCLPKGGWVRQSDGVQFWESPGNSDYKQFLDWLDEGNTPEPADPLPEPTKPTLAELQAQLEAIQAQLKDLNG